MSVMKEGGGALAPSAFAFSRMLYSRFNPQSSLGSEDGAGLSLRAAPSLSLQLWALYLSLQLPVPSFLSLSPPSPTVAGTWRETADGSHGPGWGKGPQSGLGVRVLETLHDGLKETRPFPADG